MGNSLSQVFLNVTLKRVKNQRKYDSFIKWYYKERYAQRSAKRILVNYSSQFLMLAGTYHATLKQKLANNFTLGLLHRYNLFFPNKNPGRIYTFESIMKTFKNQLNYHSRQIRTKNTSQKINSTEAETILLL